MKLNGLSLLALRLSISYIWLNAGFHKLFSSDFINSFPNTLKGFAENSSFSFYTNFLNTYIVPNSQIFAQLTIWGEILTGIAFLLGFPMLIAVLAGIFMNLNYYFVATSAPSQFLNIILIFSQFAAYSCGAGSIWGLETKLKK